MADIWFSSDHHHGHSNIIRFKKDDGSPLRTKRGVEFAHIDEHDEYLIERHNSVVKPQDKVYFLGDFCLQRKIGNKSIQLSRFNGQKRLARGNHDLLSTADYLTIGFEEVYGVRVFTPKETGGVFFCATHVPVHPSALYRWSTNLHGHTHSNKVKHEDGTNDNRYICACMEQLDDYTPLHMDEVVARIKSFGLGKGTY